MTDFRPQFGHEDNSDPGDENDSRSEPVDSRIQEALRQKEWLDELTRTKGWSIVAQFVKEQCERRVNEIMLTPAAATPEASAQVNMTRGEYAGLQLVVQHIMHLRDDAQSIIDAFKEQDNGR